MKRLALGILLALTVAPSRADAPSRDPRGWTAGQLAKNAERVLSGPAERPELALPRKVVDQIDGPTLLFYFSPTCPHCRHVAAEVQALSQRLAASEQGKVLGIASGSASEADLQEFVATFGVTFEVIVDADREIMSAMGVQSTPSAMLVAPVAGHKPKKGQGTVQVVDAWYPYLPGWDTLVEGRLAGDVYSAFRPGEYQGNAVCGACHAQEQASWELTHHAVAWRTLVRSSKETDPACNRCHVTGAGSPGGWSGDPDSSLVDVGCEACHGPGGPHDGERADAREACAGCHDSEHSIAFSLDKGLPLIDHYRANALSEAAYTQARRELYAGEAPRELLAFPAGKNVGSEACLSCHAVEHAWWSANGHARAMDELTDDHRRDPDCVRCHATAKASGPPPATLSGYDTLGGVGCESCHGPGEAHVAAGGGTDNIQGLGDSCPVCVIEAVCTSCHTPKWSPDWQLQPRLEAIAHQPKR
ncbi:MAG: multiheme c-type cytochrome [Myxococcota bacterium]